MAQHYGFDTCLLDLTNYYRTALFFATCKYDYKTDSYRPLTKKDIEATEDSKYGVIFHSPNWVLDYLNGGSFEWHMQRLNNPDKGPYSLFRATRWNGFSNWLSTTYEMSPSKWLYYANDECNSITE